MTGTLRSTARNPVAVALMGLLILVFLVIGIGGNGRFPDLFRQVRADSVVTAGGHSMSATDFRKVFDQQKQRFEEQSKQTATNSFLVQNGFDQQLLNAIAQDQSLAELLARIGVIPGPQLIDNQIKKLPFAFDRVTGKFSETQFLQFLAAQGLTAGQAQAQLADDLAQRHFLYAVQAGFQPPRIFAAMNAVAGSGKPRRQLFHPGPQDRATARGADRRPAPGLHDRARGPADAPGDARCRRGQVLRRRAGARPSTVDAAAIQKEFDFRKDSLSTPETRSVVQIPVKSAAQGTEAAARLARGEDPNAIAKSYGAQAIVYADKPVGAIADRKLAALAFSLPAGATKGPVQGDLGLAAIEVSKVTPAKVATLESARPKIEADLKQKAARDKAYQLSQAFDDARTGGANLQAAAAKAGVAVQTVGPIAATGQDLQGKPAPELTDKMLKSAFAKRVGDDADLGGRGVPENTTRMKVEKVVPPSLPTLAEARPALTKAYRRQLYLQALRGQGRRPRRQAQGRSADRSGRRLGRQPCGQTAGHAAHPGREIPGHGAGLPAERVRREARRRLRGRRPDRGLYRQARRHPPGRRDADGAGHQRHSERVWARAILSDVLEAAKAAASRQIKPQINVGLARQAIGVDPTAGPKAPGAAK